MEQLTYYQSAPGNPSAGFGELQAEYGNGSNGSSAAQQYASSSTGSYQQYIRRDFTADHSASGGGFYPAGSESSPSVTAGNSYGPTTDYYGTVYDVTSSSSSSSASVYGDMADHPAAKSVHVHDQQSSSKNFMLI